MSLKIFNEKKSDEQGDMAEVTLDKETIKCGKCNNPMKLSDKGKYECRICDKL